MTKHILVFTVILLSILSIYLGVALHIEKKKRPNIAKESLSLDSIATVAPILEYRDDSGGHHVIIPGNINHIIEDEVTKKAEELQPIIEQAAENLGVKPSQIEESTTVSVRAARDSIAFMKRQLENAQKLTFFYKDKYLTLNVKTNPKDTADLGSFDYTYNADLNITQYHKKNWLLGAKRSYTDISSNDPHATIMGVKKFTVEQQAPEFGMRLQATLGRNFITNSTVVGPSVRIDFGNKLKASIRGSALYDINNGRWGTSISIDKDLKRF